jgi:hypothetical protein
MREGLQALGPTEFFTGAMNAVIVRNVKEIHCLGAVTFTTLTFQFPAGTVSPAPVNPNTITYPVLSVLSYIESFRLLTGSIQVIYEAAA